MLYLPILAQAGEAVIRAGWIPMSWSTGNDSLTVTVNPQKQIFYNRKTRETSENYDRNLKQSAFAFF